MVFQPVLPLEVTSVNISGCPWDVFIQEPCATDATTSIFRDISDNSSGPERKILTPGQSRKKGQPCVHVSRETEIHPTPSEGDALAEDICSRCHLAERKGPKRFKSPPPPRRPFDDSSRDTDMPPDLSEGDALVEDASGSYILSSITSPKQEKKVVHFSPFLVVIQPGKLEDDDLIEDVRGRCRLAERKGSKRFKSPPPPRRPFDISSRDTDMPPDLSKGDALVEDIRGRCYQAERKGPKTIDSPPVTRKHVRVSSFETVIIPDTSEEESLEEDACCCFCCVVNEKVPTPRKIPPPSKKHVHFSSVRTVISPPPNEEASLEEGSLGGGVTTLTPEDGGSGNPIRCPERVSTAAETPKTPPPVGGVDGALPAEQVLPSSLERMPPCP